MATKTRRSNGEGSRPIQRKDGRWFIRVKTTQTATGELVRKDFYGKTRAEVVQKARDFQRTLESGQIFNNLNITLDIWLAHWLEHVAKPGIRDRTYRDYKQQLNRWVIGTRLGRMRIEKVNVIAVEQQLAYMRGQGKSEGTILKIHRLLSKAFTDAMARGLIVKHPMMGLKAPRANTTAGTALTAAQTRKLDNAAKVDHINGLSYIIALTLGLRQGERLGLTWDDVDLKTGTLTVRRALAYAPGGGFQMVEPKSVAGYRTVPIPPQLVEIFKEHLKLRRRRAKDIGKHWNVKPDINGKYWELICTDLEGNRLMPAQDRRLWHAFLQRNGIPEIRVHDARHTAATTLLGLGVAPRIVMQMMGWSSMSMLNRYQHVLDEMEREAAAKMGGAIFDVALADDEEYE